MDFSPEEIAQFKKRRAFELAQSRPVQTQTQPVKKGGRGGTLTSLISEGAGAGGAVGGAGLGAAIGTGILPGVGTIIGGGLGGLIGGFTGGFGGRAVENKVRDDEFRLEDALNEGLLSGAFGAAGGTFHAARGLKAAGKAGSNLSKAGKAAQASDDLLAKSRGITPGMGKTMTRPGLSIAESKRLNKVASELGVNKLTPKKNLEAVEIARSTLLSERADLLKNAGTLPKGTITNIKKNLTKIADTTPGINTLDDIAPDLAKMSKQKTVSGLTKYRQGIDDLINFNRSSATPDPKMDRAYKALRRSIDGELSKVSPALKSINTKLKDIYSLEDLFQESTKKQIAGTGAMKIPFLGTKLPGGSTQAIQNAGSKATAIPGQIANGVSNLFGGTGAKIATGAAIRGLVPDGTESPQQEQSLEEMLSQFATQDEFSAQPQPNQQAQPEQIGGISKNQILQAMLLDVNETGGKNLATIKALYEFMQPEEGQGQLQLSDSGIKTVNELQSGLRDISKLRESISGSQGIVDPIMGRIRGINPYDTSAQNLQAQVDRVRQVVGKALEGGVLRKEDEAKYKKILPTLTDTKTTALEKLRDLELAIAQDLENYLSLQQNTGKGGGQLPTSIEQALMGYSI
jgi:hypothetical protein